MEINNLLDQCKAKLGVDTDYKLAKKWEMHQGLLSDYRLDKREPDEYACLRIAETMGLDAEMLMVHFAARKAKNPKVREYLQKYSERLGGLAAAIFVVVTLIMTPTPSQAAPVLKSEGAIMYIMLNSRRKLNAIKKTALSLIVQISRLCVLIPRIGKMPA